MRRNLAMTLLICIGILLFLAPGYVAKKVHPVTPEDLLKNLYIGEVFSSGYVYIEPFGADRETSGKKISFTNYPDKINFYPCYKDEQIRFYDASFDSVFNTYVPDREAESGYFAQPFSKPEQYGLRYRTSISLAEPRLGVTSLGDAIVKIDYNAAGKQRPYSKAEYDRAQEEIRKDKEVNEPERTLSFIGLTETIAGARQILLIHFKETPLKLRLSEYETHTFEYSATVYVADILQDGKVIKTYKKHNWDGPY